MPVNALFNPYGIIQLGTPFEIIPFDFQHEEGNEMFSFLVPEVLEDRVHGILNGTIDRVDAIGIPRAVMASRNAAEMLKCKALYWIGRELDRGRCSIGFRIREDKRIEIRLKFGPPWWYENPNGTKR